MINSSKVEKSFQNIYSLMEKMPGEEREILTDKLLAFLLFQNTRDTTPVKQKAMKKTSKKKQSPISKKDQELLKKIVDKTDELYKKLGGDTI